MSASTTRGVLSTSRAISTSQWRGKRLVKPPIALLRTVSSGLSTFEEIPHAETSAAGAARFQRLHGFTSSTSPSHQRGVPLVPRSAAENLSRRYLTTTASASRRLPSFNTRTSTTAEANSKATARWVARKLRYDDNVGWKTPAAVSYTHL